MAMSDRTKSYVKELVRLGSDFNQEKWLREVKEAPPQIMSGANALIETNNRTLPTHASIPGTVGPALSLPDQPVGLGRAYGSQDKTAADLERVAHAWSESQRCRNRAAIYRYLSQVFLLVKKSRDRGRLKDLVRDCQKCSGIRSNRKADPYTAVIQATTHNEIDHRAVSKYARALRYSRKRKGDQSLQAFIKSRGGINACAARYARCR